MAGRPRSYTQKRADKICELVATTTKSLRTICENEEFPCVATVLRWLREDTNGFLAQYARAKEEQADLLIEEMIEIADDGSRDDTPFTGGNHVQRDKLKVETRKWLASKLKPKKYGEKLDVTTLGEKLPAANLLGIPTDKLAQIEQILTDVDSGANSEG